MKPTGPYELDDAARHDGVQHIEFLLEVNRQRMAACVPQESANRPITLGIVGAGVMGTAIAADVLAHGAQVRITDADEAALRRAADTVAHLIENDDKLAKQRLNTTGDLDEIATSEIVLEAVVEDEMKKGALLRDLDRRMPPEHLLATNTSTIPIGRLARAVRNPERLCGTHFFLPLRERPVVEVIFTDQTSPQARATAIAFTMTIGRSALFAPDAVGFLVNRLMMPYVSEGMQLLTEGVEPEVIEQVAVRFGMPKGPLSLLDEVGLDTALDCGWIFAGVYEERFAVSPLPVAMVKAGRLGQKAGAGFFCYTTNGDGTLEQAVNPAAMEVVARWAGPPSNVTEEEIAARLFLPMIFEGTRLLEEHGACRAADVDLGAVLGLGMAPWRGGPLYWCDRVGARRVLEMAKPLESLGARMKPPKPLRRMAETETTFHDQTCRA